MSFPRYERYKDSGVEWLGEVPEGWEVVPVKNVADIVNGYPFDSKLFSTTEGYPLIRIRDLNSINTETRYCGDFVELAAITSSNVLIGMDGDFNVGRWYGEGEALLNQRMCCVRGKTELVTRLLEYVLPIPLKIINDMTYATTVKHLSSFQVEKTRVAIPPLPEQQTIAAFLDRETDKIDALVAEQERLSELLKEKRQAVISHAVTKGLDPDAPMKDSGIEWLGEVPVGWEITPFKRIASIRYGIGEPPKYQEEGTPLIRATNVNAGLVTQEGMVFVNPDDIPEKRIIWLSAGDIIIVRSGAYTGDSALIRSEHCPCIAGFDMVVHPKACLPSFLQYALLSTYLKNDQIDLEKTRAAQPHLNAEELGSCVVVLPPQKDQSDIASFLDTETAKIDTLITEAQQVIGLLKERRSALISAAVTGKIDVRGNA